MRYLLSLLLACQRVRCVCLRKRRTMRQSTNLIHYETRTKVREWRFSAFATQAAGRELTRLRLCRRRRCSFFRYLLCDRLYFICCAVVIVRFSLFMRAEREVFICRDHVIVVENGQDRGERCGIVGNLWNLNLYKFYLFSQSLSTLVKFENWHLLLFCM